MRRVDIEFKSLSARSEHITQKIKLKRLRPKGRAEVACDQFRLVLWVKSYDHLRKINLEYGSKSLVRSDTDPDVLLVQRSNLRSRVLITFVSN